MYTSRNTEVCVIPATKRLGEGRNQMRKQQSLRVAAYCRVSTDEKSQQSSYLTQKDYYNTLIDTHKGWVLVGIYADEAISGTSRVRRKSFNLMMEDAINGKIDYIITKSISRFARNTVDTLNCVRQLRQLNCPVGIFFEKENIDTLDAAGELMLTILSALAQDESRSISENIRWSIQKKFQRGEPIVNLNRMLGYDKGKNGEWIVNTEQAKIVRYIFDRFLQGVSANRIARELNERGEKTICGFNWRADGILKILRNEKHVGDLELQKTVTKDFLTHEITINRGEAPKYYISNHHEAIIDRLSWEKTQAILKGRSNQMLPFANLLCGNPNCGKTFSRMAYNGERKRFYYIVWKCNCGSICECSLEQSFMEMLYAIRKDYDKNKETSRIFTTFNRIKKVSDEETKNFDFFMRCISALPKENDAGVSLNVFRRDLCEKGSISNSPDYLKFDNSIYYAFVESGIVKGDEIFYKMKFGITLKAIDCNRKLTDFQGYRIAWNDKSMHIIDDISIIGKNNSK